MTQNITSVAVLFESVVVAGREDGTLSLWDTNGEGRRISRFQMWTRSGCLGLGEPAEQTRRGGRRRRSTEGLARRHTLSRLDLPPARRARARPSASPRCRTVESSRDPWTGRFDSGRPWELRSTGGCPLADLKLMDDSVCLPSVPSVAASDLLAMGVLDVGVSCGD